jgi:hypothetical protein
LPRFLLSLIFKLLDSGKVSLSLYLHSCHMNLEESLEFFALSIPLLLILMICSFLQPFNPCTSLVSECCLNPDLWTTFSQTETGNHNYR